MSNEESDWTGRFEVRESTKRDSLWSHIESDSEAKKVYVDGYEGSES